MNEIILAENRQLRERLQACQSRSRVVTSTLERFRQSLLTRAGAVGIDELSELMAELETIRLMLLGSEEGGGRC